MRKIKHKIIAGVMAVVTLSLLIGLGFTYWYFHGMLSDQIISDNKIKLSQTARMLEYISDDTLKLGYTAVADEDITGFILSEGYLNVAQEVNDTHNMVKRMQQYISMRDYVHSMALVRGDGSVIWDKAPFDHYFADVMKESWYTSGNTTSKRFYFTPPHQLSGLYHQDETVVSLVAPIVNPNNPSEDSGQVIVNIRLDWLVSHISEDASYFDDFAWTSADGQRLYWPDGRIGGQMKEEMAMNPAFSGPENLAKINGGYVIQEAFQDTDWVLSAYISEGYIGEKLRRIPILFICIGLLCIVANVIFLQPIVLKITRPVDQLVDLMETAGEGNLSVQSQIRTNDEMEILGEGFNKMMSQLNEYLVLTLENEKQIREQEYDLILARLNPHFIYNTLNTAVYLAKRDGSEDCAAVAGSLIFLLQDIIQISDRSVQATLGHELETVRHYLTIQEYRYPDKFTVIIDVPGELENAVIPKTVLQPLVENALIHGIFPTGRAGVLKIQAALDNGVLVLTVSDNGTGADRASMELAIQQKRKEDDAARHIGLNSIVERLKFMYGSSYGITFQSEIGKGTSISICLPYHS